MHLGYNAASTGEGEGDLVFEDKFLGCPIIFTMGVKSMWKEAQVPHRLRESMC
jgi:hypothetical protein